MKKKKTVKKLVLNREVLYKIADGSLEQIQGGDFAITVSGPPGINSQCSC